MTMSTPPSSWTGTVIQISNDGMGTAPTELRRKLIRIYLRLLLENGYLPSVITFYAEGVRLVVEGSDLLETLAALEAKGVHLIACQTCLKYYGLADQVRVGVVGGMHDIIEAQRVAAKVVTL